MNNFKFLAEKENLKRLSSCDFNLNSKLDDECGKVSLSLKELKNPLLILFYYNQTDTDYLTTFYQATEEKNLEKGEDGSPFLFGYVNLDYEKEILKKFKELKGFHPFSWLKIPQKIKYPFIIFYYENLPQFIYEGVLSTSNIKKEFSQWLTELKEEQKINKDKENFFQEGYYYSLENNEKIYAVRVENKINIRKENDSTASMKIKEFNQSYKFEDKEKKIKKKTEEEEKIYNLEHPGGEIRKKQIYLDNFFIEEIIANGGDFAELEKFIGEDIFSKSYALATKRITDKHDDTMKKIKNKKEEFEKLKTEYEKNIEEWRNLAS